MIGYREKVVGIQEESSWSAGRNTDYSGLFTHHPF